MSAPIGHHVLQHGGGGHPRQRPSHCVGAPQSFAGQHFDLATALDDQPFDHVEGIHLGLSQVERGDIPARRRSLPAQASAAIQHAVALQNAADGPDAGQREQGALGAQRVGNDLRPVKPQRTGRGQTLSTGQYRQLHLRGRAIVDSSGGSGVGAPVHLLEPGCTRPSEPPLQRRKRHPKLGRHLPLGSALADCRDHVAPTVVKRFFSSCHLSDVGGIHELTENADTYVDRDVLTLAHYS